MSLPREQEQLLVSAVCAGGETYITRRYGEVWGTEIDHMRALERSGFMRFTKCFRAVGGNDYIRRSAITDDGRAAIAPPTGKSDA